jgi:predicted PP-loop superfamily ATPase
LWAALSLTTPTVRTVSRRTTQAATTTTTVCPVAEEKHQHHSGIRTVAKAKILYERKWRVAKC